MAPQQAASGPPPLTRLIRLSVGSALVAWVSVKIWPAARKRGRRLHAYLKRKRRLAEYGATMRIITADVVAIRDAMVKDARGSLAGNGSCSLPMIPAFVENLPTGKERGDYFALDLGGTNFRVRHVSIVDGALKSTSQEATLSDEVLKATVAELFDFMVEIAIPFMSKVVDLGSVVPRIGFTFSFPMNQTAIAEGTLLRWTKGYTCPDGVGSDPVNLLKEAFHRKGFTVEVPVLANDTVALLAAGRYQRADCKMAVILGTGTNAAYMERAEAVASIAGNRKSSSGHDGSGGGSGGSGMAETAEMAINTEWSDLRLPGPVRLLQEDLDMDAASNNPGFQIYEKLISGMHLGDIVRHILVTLADEGLLWVQATPPEALRSPRRIPTSAISGIDDTAAGEAVAKAREVLGGLGLDPDLALTHDELEAIVRVCGMIGRRAARLAATGMLAVARLQGLDTPEAPGFCIAIDGGLYKHYASLRRQIRETFVEVLGEKISSRVELIMVGDGSGDGAALLAAAATSSSCA